MPKTVLLTGAGGFLAGHFATAFAAAGWQVIGVGRSDPLGQAARFSSFHRQDLGELDPFTSLLTRVAPTVLVHLAAPASVPGSLREPLADLLAHLVPTANVLEAVRRSGVDARVILVSSAAVYGNPATLPVPESAALTPISPYGFHKVQQELVVDQYVELHGLRACKARVFSTYGENLRRLAVWEVTQRALAGNHEVLGTGEESRDYLDARDVARGMVCLAERAEFRGESVNIASGEEVAVRALATEIFRLTGLAGSPRFTGESLIGSPIRWRADTSRLRELGWSPPATWSSGLGRTIEWIRAQPLIAR